MATDESSVCLADNDEQQQSTPDLHHNDQTQNNGNVQQQDLLPQTPNTFLSSKQRPVISSTSCRQLVAGNYDVIINESTTLRSLLLDYLERFNQYELALGQANCCYSNEFKMLKEFSKTLKEDKSNLEHGEQDYNQRKNRYKDIIPFSHTRVILSNEPNSMDPGNSYINANYIRGPSGSQKAYIACQGPLQSTLNDFWRMIWECNVSVIIMACNEYESGKPKCEIYWPTQLDTSHIYGRIQVTLLRERVICSDFLIRKFSVKLLEPISSEDQRQQQQRMQTNGLPQTNRSGATLYNSSDSSSSTSSSSTNCGNGSPNRNNHASDRYNGNCTSGNKNIIEDQRVLTSDINNINDINPNHDTNSYTTDSPMSYPSNNIPDAQKQSREAYRLVSERTICQFHYTTWPDHGVPNSVHPILELVRLVREVQPAEDRPILVHCSAGCGRTGTICCIDYVWGLLRRDKIDSNFNLCSIISDMRQQRMAMVQTLEQYILCHRTVAALFMQQLDFMDDSSLNDNLESIEDGDDKVFDEQDIGPVFI